nr:flagellar hook-associated protein FlgK [Cytophagales bacterium]
MSTLFGSLSVSRQSLQNMQLGITVTGHNMANASTEGYSRQRVVIEAEKQFDGVHILGVGAYTNQIQRVHDELLDRRIQLQKSDDGMLQAEKDILDLMEANLGQIIDRQSLSAEGSAAAQGIGAPNGLGEFLDDFFNTISALSADPTSSALRNQLVQNAKSLTAKFNSNDKSIEDLKTTISDQTDFQISEANSLIQQISELNHAIALDENKSRGQSNDLRDQRQKNIEKLAEIISIETSSLDNGIIEVKSGGVVLTGVKTPKNLLTSYVDTSGALRYRTQEGALEIAVTSGGLAGLSRAHNQSLPKLQENLNELASEIISRVNSIYQEGYDLKGNTGNLLFSGTGASDIAVDEHLLNNPQAFQGSADGTTGNNEIITKLFELSLERIPNLGDRTLSGRYAEVISEFGHEIQSLETSIVDNNSIGTMLTNKRQSISGVSLDEEMTNLIQYQRAYQASARVIGIIDEMVQTVIGLGN